MAEVEDEDKDWPEGSRAPAWLEEKIRRQLAEGVSLSCRWRADLDDRRSMEVAAIHWRPGEPNALAAIILKHVTAEPMPLSLDGKLFMVQRVEEWPQGWDDLT